MNKRIYIKDWMKLKPYEREAKTDMYYLRQSNEVKDAIIGSGYTRAFKAYLTDDEINLLSCFLTSYFEDIISGTNIWNSFVSNHTRLYNETRPNTK
jgi:hypothetical protein